MNSNQAWGFSSAEANPSQEEAKKEEIEHPFSQEKQEVSVQDSIVDIPHSPEAQHSQEIFESSVAIPDDSYQLTE